MASGYVMNRSECTRLLVLESDTGSSDDESPPPLLAADPGIPFDGGSDGGCARTLPLSTVSADVPQVPPGNLHVSFADRLQASVESAQLLATPHHPRRHYSKSLSLEKLRGTPDDDGSRLTTRTAELYKAWRTGAFVIVPQMGVHSYVRNMLDFWDLFMNCTIIMTAVIVPLEISLIHMPPMGAFDHAFDAAFILDIVLQFFIAVPNHQNDHLNDFWERDPVMIARQYVGLPCCGCWENGGGAFWVDIVSLSSFFLSKFYPAIGLATIRIVRLLRLMRVLCLTRLKRAFDRLQGKLGYSYHAVNLTESFALTILACHWLTCVWICTEGSIYDDKTLSYHSESGRTWLVALVEAKGDPCHPSVQEDPMCVYSLALYFTVMTLTTVGYGDIAPQNLFEYRVVILMIMVSAILWTMLMGSIVNVLTKFDPLTGVFRQNLDDLNEMCTSKSLPTELRTRLRSYMHESKTLRRNKEQRRTVMEHVSPGLQGEVALQCVGKWLDKYVYWSQDLEEGARIAMASCLNSCLYAPQEYIVQPTALVILMRGIAAHYGSIFSKGKVWGHDRVLLDSHFLIETFSPKTLSYVEVLTLARSDIRAVCSNFPAADKKVRRAQVRFATCRAIIHVAAAIRRIAPAKSSRASSPGPQRYSVSPPASPRRPPSGEGQIFEPLGGNGWPPSSAPVTPRPTVSNSEFSRSAPVSPRLRVENGPSPEDPPLTAPGPGGIAHGVRRAVDEVINSSMKNRSFASGAHGDPPPDRPVYPQRSASGAHGDPATDFSALEERVANVVRRVMREELSSRQAAQKRSPFGGP